VNDSVRDTIMRDAPMFAAEKQSANSTFDTKRSPILACRTFSAKHDDAPENNR
jgi:hypothetical protein